MKTRIIITKMSTKNTEDLDNVVEIARLKNEIKDKLNKFSLSNLKYIYSVVMEQQLGNCPYPKCQGHPDMEDYEVPFFLEYLHPKGKLSKKSLENLEDE